MTQQLLTRRQTLAMAAGACSSLLLSGCQTAGPHQAAAVGGYIDAHSHVWSPDTARFPLGPWITPAEMEPPSFTARQLLDVAQPCGVARAVLIQHAPYYGDDNSYLIDCAAQFPGRFSIVAIVEERRPDLAAHLRLLANQGVRGIRIGPTRYADRSLVRDPANWLNAPAMRKLWTLATDQGLMLCPLVSPEFLPTLDPMLAQFPATTVVIDHFGHAKHDEPQQMQALIRLARHRQVHVKVSGFYKFGDAKAPYDDLAPMIRQVVQAFGADRLMWGSDCPYQLQNGNNYADAVALIESGAGFLSSDARNAILRTTAQRLFFGT